MRPGGRPGLRESEYLAESEHDTSLSVMNSNDDHCSGPCLCIIRFTRLLFRAWLLCQALLVLK